MSRRSVEPVVPAVRPVEEPSSAEEGEFEEDVEEPAVDVGPMADGVPCPLQPGECDAALLPFISPSALSGGAVVQGGCHGDGGSHEGGACGPEGFFTEIGGWECPEGGFGDAAGCG